MPALRADFKMWWLWLTGRLDPELRNAGVTTPGEQERRLGD